MRTSAGAPPMPAIFDHHSESATDGRTDADETEGGINILCTTAAVEQQPRPLSRRDPLDLLKPLMRGNREDEDTMMIITRRNRGRTRRREKETE